jgi:hypothetical protein
MGLMNETLRCDLKSSESTKVVTATITNVGGRPASIRRIHGAEDFLVPGADGVQPALRAFGFRSPERIVLQCGESTSAPPCNLPSAYSFTSAQRYSVKLVYRAMNWMYRPSLNDVDDLCCASEPVQIDIEASDLDETKLPELLSGLLIDLDKLEAWKRGEISLTQAITESEKYRAHHRAKGRHIPSGEDRSKS